MTAGLKKILNNGVNFGINLLDELTWQIEKLTHENKLARKLENISKGELKTKVNEIFIPATGILEKPYYLRVIYVESKKGKFALIPGTLPENKKHYLALGTQGYKRIFYKYQTNADMLARQIYEKIKK